MEEVSVREHSPKAGAYALKDLYSFPHMTPLMPALLVPLPLAEDKHGKHIKVQRKAYASKDNVNA